MVNCVNVKVKRLFATVRLPEYMTEHAAGMDIYAALTAPETILPGSRALIPTGLVIELPIGYEAQIRPRSGLALKHGITLANTPGTIDADYRGEIKIIMINLGQEDFVVEPGARIAQIIVAPYTKVQWLNAQLNETDRNNGGFGHTG